MDYYPEGTLIWLEADVLIRQRQNDSAKIVGINANVAVIDDQVLESRTRQHLLEITDLHIRAKLVWRHNQPYRASRKLALQLLHAGNGGIIRIADAEDDFVLGIVLQAMTAETLEDVRIGSLQRLKN